MKFHQSIARITLASVAITLCGVPEAVQAQSVQPSSTQAQQSAPAEQQPNAATPGTDTSGTGQSAPQQNKGMINPSQGPLAPVPSNPRQLPSAPSSTQTQPQNQPSTLPLSEQRPGGAAAAQTGPTAGGPASRPSGNAIAPAKQRQVRSLLIKLGAVAAAGIAIGTVVGLSKGSPSKPPGAK
jgi:hypothetical protein